MDGTKRSSRRRRRRTPKGNPEVRRPRGRADASDRKRSGSSRPGGDRVVTELQELGPFSVFCALHLGITERDGYAPANLSQVARRFDLSNEELEQYLEDHALHARDLEDRGFDLESAQLDIEVAPEGISRVELARTLFDELKSQEPA